MRKLTVFLCVIALVFGVTVISNAELHDRGGGLIYDDVLDITWLQDANLARSLRFGVPDISSYGSMNWYTAQDWIAAMNTSNYLGYSDWRLPKTLPVNGSSYIFNDPYWTSDGSTDYGYNISAPGSAYPGSTASELAYMFYCNLGNLGRRDINGNLQAGYGLQHTGPFINIQPWDYVSGTERTNDFWVFIFLFDSGMQGEGTKPALGCYAWAVRDGDVGAVPIPSAVDIKPGACPNPINIKSKGVLPVAILGTEDFDVNQIDPESLALEGVPPLQWCMEDVTTPYDPVMGKEACDECTEEGPDGYMDLTLKFKNQKVIEALGDVQPGDCLLLTLTGCLKEEFGGTPIVGEDVVIVKKK